MHSHGEAVKIKGDKEYEVSVFIHDGFPADKVLSMNYVSFRIKRETYSYYLGLCRSPTGNCQISSIGSVFQLIGNNIITKKDAILVLKEMYRQINMVPVLVAMDVNSVYIKDIERCFTIVHKMPYMSSNSSNMCWFLVKLI